MFCLIKTIKKYKTRGSRLNIKEKDTITIIDDCYNSNYEAVIGLINVLDEVEKDKVLILGDILELGKYSKRIHKRLGKVIRNKHYRDVYYIGKFMYFAHKENPCSKWFKTVDDFLEKQVKINNCVIAIKGSRSMHLEKVVNYFN